jgi:NAD(P)H-dependent FMN reductase
MPRIGVIVGSSRPNRVSPAVATLVADALDGAFEVEVIDLATVALPFFDEPESPMSGSTPIHAHTRAWAERVEAFDGFVIITPEYNAGYPAILKNALDFLAAEWRDKPVAVVAYGWYGGARAASALSPVLANVKLQEVEGVSLTFGEHLVDGAWSQDPAVRAAVQADLAGLLARLQSALFQAVA